MRPEVLLLTMRDSGSASGFSIPLEFFMEAFLSSTLAVAIAEIGDKTQLLALFLVSRYGRPYIISLGVLIATVLNHALSAWLGAWLADVIPESWIPWLISGSFILVALWLLVPDKEEDDMGRFAKYGPFMATCVLFFLAEIGDKTQIATVILAAKYSETLWMTVAVIAGTTLGMLLANVPVIFAGRWLLERLPLDYARKGAFVLFVALAVITFIKA
ncbi:MAG TPA: TMEM165/GDT1 family protein [Cellvibrio sp.]|nr:TMEM165/GDT1 family protein [Cellvibrio sp.]